MITQTERDFLADLVKDICTQALEGNTISQIFTADALRLIEILERLITEESEQTQATSSASEKSSS